MSLYDFIEWSWFAAGASKRLLDTKQIWTPFWILFVVKLGENQVTKVKKSSCALNLTVVSKISLPELECVLVIMKVRPTLKISGRHNMKKSSKNCSPQDWVRLEFDSCFKNQSAQTSMWLDHNQSSPLWMIFFKIHYAVGSYTVSTLNNLIRQLQIRQLVSEVLELPRKY